MSEVSKQLIGIYDAVSKRVAANDAAFINNKMANKAPPNYIYAVWVKFADYLALVLGIMLLMFVFYLAYRSTKSSITTTSRQRTFSTKQDGGGSVLRRMTDSIGSVFAPIGNSFSRMNPLRGDPPTIPRPTLGSGRCDNIQWRDVGGDGNSGLCARTYITPATSWVLDADRMGELKVIPEDKAEAIQGKNGENMQIFIPWKVQGTFYVPQCKDAYSIRKDHMGNEQRVPMGHLLEERGLSCKRRELPSTSYEVRYRPKESRQIDAWASADDPKY